MGKAEEIIRRYAEAKEPVEGFGSWLLADRDSAEKEEALSGLWSLLEATPAVDDVFLRRAKLSSLMHRIPKEKAVSSIRRWIWLMPVAAAAALCLLLLLPHAGVSPSIIPDQPMTQAVEEVSVVPEDDQEVEKSEPVSVLAQVALSLSYVRVPSHSPSSFSAIVEDGRSEPFIPINEVVVESEETHVSESDREIPSSGQSPEASADNPVTYSKEDKDAVTKQWAALERQDRLERQKKSRPLSMGLQASGGLITLTSSQAIASTPGQPISMIGTHYSTGLPSGTEMEEKIRYDVPFRAGVSLFLPLNERLSFGTGLDFTLFHFSSYSSVYVSKDNRYRYLGIPLTLNYRLVSGNRGSLYGMTSIDANYLLKGWSTVRMPDGEPVVSSFSAHPLQFSVRFGAGYEFFIYHRWSLYAEASLDYYFKNTSCLDSFFFQKPLIPAATLGIHYTLSR